ncbi:hypothetical protein ACIPYS_06595 [Kitasatospora sp. NPDC089913]|uniref:hypothetical protein n=1 Tax=Kitasatospora sp. NPDC089913 TaxID=3364080 RepID=UPI00382205FB
MAFAALSANTVPADAAPTAPKSSEDRAWTTTGDAEGFHIVVADARDGYAWRTAASLSEPGFDTDLWIGNACVTGSGRHAVVVYAPRTFTNRPELMARGGFTAIVDLADGTVTKLDLQASLSYYNPGCGVDETAVLTQSGGEDRAGTRLIRVDAATGRIAAPIETEGQLTSAVPVKDGSVVAAGAGALVKVETSGATTPVSRTVGVPFRLTADKDGGVVFLDSDTAARSTADRSVDGPGTGRTTDSAVVGRVAGDLIRRPDVRRTRPTELARGPLTATGLTRDAAGTVYVTGPVTRGTEKPPTSTRLLPTAPKEARVSTKGETVVTLSEWADGRDSRLGPDEARSPRPVMVALGRTDGGRIGAGTVDPGAVPSPNRAQGAAPSPKLGVVPAPGAAGAAVPGATTADPTETVESERTCAVPRNDPRNQAVQPKPRQVEWAVDQAVQGTLNQNTVRPANWKNLGMPAYQPQALFPRPILDGNGRVPAQIMLGVAAQESNLWQAARSAVPGVTGNPLIGNYYGIDYYDGNPANDWDVNWSKADCGYGVTQVTDGMRLAGKERPGETALPYQTQRAVALDYVTNIAAGLQILSNKWNQTRAAGLTVNNGYASKIENWYFALWAYNSGFYPRSGDGGPWGVGWANNPANPEWDAGRLPFLEHLDGTDDYSDAAHPQDWPYQEKVIGWAGHPLEGLESPGKMVSGYRQAWWNGKEGSALTPGSAKNLRAAAKPEESWFCTAQNNCMPGYISDGSSNSPGQGPCARDDLKCWWNQPVTWKADCDYSCGNELVRFNDTYKEEPDGTAYPPACSLDGLPAGALVIDDVADDVPSVRPGCPRPAPNAGTFTMTFGSDPNAATFPAKADLHQLGAGFGGHFFFSHTRADDAKGRLLRTSGSWRLNRPIETRQAKVYVHVPDHGAQTRQAVYEVVTDAGPARVAIDQTAGTGKNRWVPLGAFAFGNTVPEVRLTNIVPGGTGDADIAFDAVAFVPGNYVMLADFNLPEADENAPDIEYESSYLEDERQVINLGVGGGAGWRANTPENTCGPIDRSTGRQTCIRVDPMTPEELVQVAETRSREPAPGAGLAAASPDLLPGCVSSISTPSTMSRFDACVNRTVTLTYLQNQEPIGTLVWGVTHMVKLTFNETYFDEQYTWTPLPGFTALGETSPMLSFQCAPACSTTVTGSEGGWLWVPGDYHTAKTWVRHQWTVPTGTTGSTSIDMGVAISPRVPEFPETTGGGLNNLAYEVRCDNEVPARRPGCVMKDVVPVLKLNTKRYPAAGALYWWLQKRLATHPGSAEWKRPLNRESSEANRTANRAVICPGSWTAPAVATDSPSCDEYPFAASKQGGGGQNPPTGFTGNDCAQLYASRMGNGPYKLAFDPRFALPTVDSAGYLTAVCGRGAIPLKHNTGIASPMGWHLFKGARVLENDRFYVGTPGYAGCDPFVSCTPNLP